MCVLYCAYDHLVNKKREKQAGRDAGRTEAENELFNEQPASGVEYFRLCLRLVDDFSKEKFLRERAKGHPCFCLLSPTLTLEYTLSLCL